MTVVSVAVAIVNRFAVEGALSGCRNNLLKLQEVNKVIDRYNNRFLTKYDQIKISKEIILFNLFEV